MDSPFVFGQLSRVDTQYDFIGNVLKQRESHGVTANTTDVLETVNTYDDRSRLLTATSTLNGGTPAIVTYEYDAVGRLIKKQYGNHTTENMEYNIRGWLTSKESEPFKMKLHYESPVAGATACYNGNISEWEWQQGTNTAQLYGFTYDPVSRLKETNQYRHAGTTWSVSPNDYVEKGITYDRNGNILTLQRTGNGTLLTNLALSYMGNQQSGQSYDANGNKISGRGMHYTYNILGLQDKVFQDNTNALKAQYDYMANGIKLRLRDGSGSNGYDYDGKFIYSLKNGTLSLDLVTFAEGQFTVNGVRYALRDHLRNVRALVNANGTVVEQNDYYPYGSVHSQPDYLNAGNRYLLSGKEEQLLTDAGIYDFGFRMYDSNTGSWNAMDKLCEKHYEHTPYMYAYDNPLRYIDLWGLENAPVIDGGTLSEVVVTADRKKTSLELIGMLMQSPVVHGIGDISEIGGALASTYGGLEYTKRFWETGYFRTQKGVLYSLDILEKGANGKYVPGVQGIRIAAKTAKESTEFIRTGGKFLGYISFGLSVYEYAVDPNFRGGLDITVGVVGLAVWEVGAAYTVTSTFYDLGDYMWTQTKELYRQGENYMNNLTHGLFPF